MPRPAALYNRRKWQLIGKSQWYCSANCGHPLNALTYNWTRSMQLANTPPLQSTAPGLHPVSFHQMAPPVRGNTHPITAYYSVYRPRKDERLSRPFSDHLFWYRITRIVVDKGPWNGLLLCYWTCSLAWVLIAGWKLVLVVVPSS